jgi:integrase/recombinase XerD
VEGKYIRRSLKTRSWERAEELKREIEDGKTEQKSITIEDTLEAFIKDCEARNLNPSTLRKYRRLAATLSEFSRLHGFAELAQLGKQELRRYREGRNLGPRTASKELERLRAFFRFCVENGWLTSNPAKSIKAPQVKVNPRLPFSEKEIANILVRAKDDRELAFILLLRHTGLRIGDASLLKVSQFDGERVHLYTTKAGVPVSLRLPPQLTSLLKKIPPSGGYFFLRGESVSPHTTADLWRRRIKILCKEAKVMPDHPHRFRHSLAADLLMKGASVEDVAAILGNSPAIVVKHYSQWIRGRQERLDAFMEKTWEPKLVRVK